MTFDPIVTKLNSLKLEHKELDLLIKYKHDFISHAQLKIYKKRRALLNKEIKQLAIKFQLKVK